MRAAAASWTAVRQCGTAAGAFTAKTMVSRPSQLARRSHTQTQHEPSNLVDSHQQVPLHGWPSNSTSGPDQKIYTAGPTWKSWGLPGRASTGMRRHLGASTLSRVGTPSTMPWCLRRLRRTVRANGSVPASLRSPRRRRVGSALAPALALHCEDWHQLDRYWCLPLCLLHGCSLTSLLQVMLDQAARPVLGQHGMQAVLLTIERPQSACTVHAA